MMKLRLKLLIISILAIASNIKAATNLSNIREESLIFRVTDSSCDTIDFHNRIIKPDNKLVLWCENWCQHCYKELERLYTEGIIDFLKQNYYSLIILSDKYPFPKLNNASINRVLCDSIIKDFEIYYNVIPNKILNDLTGKSGIPYLIIINNGVIIQEKSGLKDSYLDIISSLTELKIQNQGINSNHKSFCNPINSNSNAITYLCPTCKGHGYICPRCKGVGHVKPNPRSMDPDEFVGICRLCSGRGFPGIICTKCDGTGRLPINNDKSNPD